MHVLRRTRSLCPECLRAVDAQYISDDLAVYLEKHCPTHGAFRTPVWRAGDGTPSFDAWRNDTPPSYPHLPAGTHDKGCPFDCGLCPDHAQRTCCALVEVTRRCNMRCPLCYASSDGAYSDPDLKDVADMLSTLHRYGGRANVQLSGGEPTVRDDLPEIIRLAHDSGFPFVQLNTNGLRLAREADYAKQLKQAGLDLVYLQWDGMRESTFTTLRGAPCLSDKQRAAQRCIEAGLSVLLVATLVRGVNDDELGALLRKALSLGPHLRGLHLQPAASFGRYPWHGKGIPRLTLPEIMQALEVQSNGMVRARDFRPPLSEHALCSFSALYQRIGNTGLELVAHEQDCCCSPHGEAQRARDFVARHWGALAPAPETHDRPDAGNTPVAKNSPSLSDSTLKHSLKPGDYPEFDAFLAASSLRQRFTLSAMAFQDAYSLDLERVRRCHIHIVAQGKGLVPFCLYNLTSASGTPLYGRN